MKVVRTGFLGMWILVSLKSNEKNIIDFNEARFTLHSNYSEFTVIHSDLSL